jgi:sugar O-acyltransferase (sialic acid O-acetyltransferase NeuD family)
MKNIAFIGAGGHAKVVIDLLKQLNMYHIVGMYDDNKVGYFNDIPILGKIKDLNIRIENYVITIGNDKIRKKIYNNYVNLNYPVLIHPSAIIADNVKINKGTIIMAGAIIQTYVEIGKMCILNTKCSIDHESTINDFTSICPGATICGQVNIGNTTFIGANSVIIQNINIGNNCIIGAGSVVIRDVENNVKKVGNPAKIIN